MKIKAEILNKADLTPRECQVLALICEAAPDKLIARSLAISIKTVHSHIDRIYLKLDVRQASVNARCAAISGAVARGIVRLSTTALCFFLMMSVFGLDHHALRVGAGRTSVARRLES